MRVWINDVQEREILKKRACAAAAAARMMNDFDFERSRRQSLSPSQDWPSELVQSFLFFLFFPWRWREGWESPGKYQLGWAIVLWGLYRTLKEREREKGTDDEEKVLYTKHSRERFFIVGHRRECARGFLHPRCVGRAREKRPFFLFSPSSIAATGSALPFWCATGPTAEQRPTRIC